MTILTRYILTELLKVFFGVLTALTILFVLVLVGNEARRQGLGIGPILRLIPYILPTALCFAVPATTLFAVCAVYGRISSANEIVVLKSLGITPWKAMWPAIILASILSVVAVALNDVAVSWGYKGLHRVVLQSVEEIAYGVLRTQRTYSTDRFAISVKGVEGKQLVRPTITFVGNQQSPTVTITAESARLQSDLSGNTLSIFITNGVVEAGDRVSGVYPDTFEYVIPMADASKTGVGRSASHLSWLGGGIRHAVRDHKQKIARLEESLAAEAGFALATGDFRSLRNDAWQHRRHEVTETHAQINRLRIEPWRRFVSGFSCLCFVCVGAPLAVWRRNPDYMQNFFFCFLPILLVWYPLFYTALLRSKAGDFPPATMWLGNLVCIVAGYWLMRKVLKH